jgi:phi13 family phage major tail protein
MAHIGMKYPVAAPWKSGKTYDTEGFVIGKAISFTGTPNKNDVDLYADDAVAETDKSTRDLSVSLNVDDLELKVQADLLGHTYTAAGTGESTDPESMVIGTDDIAPYFGTGFYKRRRKNNVTTFTAIWLYKVQYSEPTESAETKGESVNFQTPTIEGKAYAVEVDGKTLLYEKAVHSTEAAAKAWLNKMAGITG